MVTDELKYEYSYTKDARINIRVTGEYLEKLHDLKRKTGIPISEMIRRGLNQYLEKHLLVVD